MAYAKIEILKIIRDKNPDKNLRIRQILDEYRGSYAAKYFIEAILAMTFVERILFLKKLGLLNIFPAKTEFF
jgi:hypothetical protein